MRFAQWRRDDTEAYRHLTCAFLRSFIPQNLRNTNEGDEEEGKCGLLLCTMYGTRDASSAWQKDSTSLLQQNEFSTGKACTCIFTHVEKDIRLLVHGHDFLVLADEEGHEFVDQVLKSRYEFKCDEHIGPGRTKQTMFVLNGLLTYHLETRMIRYAADPRHSETLLGELNLEKAKPANTPAEKKKQREAMKTLELPPLDDWMKECNVNTDSLQ